MRRGPTSGGEGFTLIELIVVIAVIAILASMAIPNFLAARTHANESAAISTLRNLTTGESQVQVLGVIDVDRDGMGEYAYFGELSGETAVRGFGSAMVPPSFSRSFGQVVSSRVNRSGYLFQIYLPDAAGRGVAEDPTGGKANATEVDADHAELFWCAYAWPADRAQTGIATFFCNQAGDLLRCANTVARYSGSTSRPNFDAAFRDAGSMLGDSAMGTTGQDGELWTRIQ